MNKWTDDEIRRMEEDEEYWDQSAPPVLIEPAPPERRGTVFSLRMTQEQAKLIGQAAEAAGVSPFDFIREAALERAKAGQAGTQPPSDAGRARVGTGAKRQRARPA